MRVALVFPGQGSQYVGMGQELSDVFPEVRKLFQRANTALDFDLAQLCFHGPREDLTRTDHAQPALLTLAVASWQLLAPSLANIVACAGHSLGEYAALVAAGALSFEVALRLVAERGRLMQQAPAGAMAAIIGLDRKQIAECLQQSKSAGVVVAANFNSPGQVVISGESPAIEAATAAARASGARQVVKLNAGGAFHSPLMRLPSDQLAARIAAAPFADATIPVVMNVDGKPRRAAHELRSALTKQMTSSVFWEDSVATMRALGAGVFIECGPGRVLSGLIRRCDRKAEALNVEDAKTLEATQGELARFDHA